MIDLEKEIQHVSQLPTDERLQALKRILPKRTVNKVLRKARSRQRYCRRLPGWFMVWFVVGLGFYGRDDYCQVYRWLQQGKRVPGRSTLCEARQSVGVAPFQLLWKEIVHYV